MARPLNELVGPGWAEVLEPVGDTITAIGTFLRDEVGAGRGRGCALQEVITPQGDDADGGVAGDAEIHPGQTAAAGIARHPGPANPHGDLQGQKGGFQLGGQGVLGRQTQPGGDGISQQGDDLRLGGGGGGKALARHQAGRAPTQAPTEQAAA